MEKDPARRFADADEFIDALQTGRLEPITAPPALPPPVEVWEEEEDRHGRRWWVWLLALLAIAAIALGIYLTLKPQQLDVPNVIGRKEATASQILQNRGFEVNIERVANADVARDEVAAQDPRPQTQAAEGSTVTITVSTGPGEASVPDVHGLARADAEDQVRAAGFEPKVEQVFSADVRKGRVVDTSPPQGSLIERGSPVTLRVSRGPEQVAVPDVVGETEDNARSAIEAAGLRVGEVTAKETVDKDPGTVLEQSPAKGTTVAKGSAVKLTVAKAPPDVTVPDVVDQTEDEARRMLQAAGFEVRVRDQTVTDATQDGVVLDQSPQGLEKRPKGSRVRIVVGRLATATPTPTPTPTPSP
jgi:serine/threonine-protein kinase